MYINHYPLDTVPSIQERDIEATIDITATCTCNSSVSTSEIVVWVLVSILTVLFTGLLSVNVTVLWLYQKRQNRAVDGGEIKCEMEGNPCYEATTVKQTTETHHYETVRMGRGEK